MRISIKQLFIASFTFTIVVKAMDGLPFMGKIPLYTLCIFSAIWGMFYLVDKRKKICDLNTCVLKIIIILAGYTILWGTILVIPNIKASDLLHEMMRRCLMLVVVFISALWISRYNCIRQVAHYSYISLLFLMLILFGANIQYIDLGRTLSAFWKMSDTVRYRTLFGFESNNIAAELALSVILLSLPELCDRKKLTQKKVVIYLTNFAMMLIIIANNSRGTLVVALFMLMIYIFLKSNGKFSLKKIVQSTIIIGIFLSPLIIWGIKLSNLTFEKILNVINRQHLLANIEILNSSGRQLTGLGNFSGAFFKEQNCLYGLNTDYMEMFYAGVYIRSGIIGSVVIITVLSLFLFSIIRAEKREFGFWGKWNLLIFIYMLSISFFEQYMFSIGYASSILFLTIISSYIQWIQRKNHAIHV